MNEKDRLIDCCDLLILKVEELREEIQHLRNALDNLSNWGVEE